MAWSIDKGRLTTSHSRMKACLSWVSLGANRGTACPMRLVIAIVLIALGAVAAEGWVTLVEDDFSKPHIQPHWRVQRGEWWIEKGALHADRGWPSDNRIMCEVPHPAGDVRLALTLALPAKAGATVSLRAGETAWGGGGIVDALTVSLAAPEGQTEVALNKERAPAVSRPADKRRILLVPGKAARLVMTVKDSTMAVEVDGRALFSVPVNPSRSWIGRYASFNVLPAGAIRDFRLEARKGANPAIPFVAATPEQNRQATVDAAPMIDPKRAGAGIQQALDKLPPTGGTVKLPEGVFTLRRHLRLPNHSSLIGAGAGKTILVIPPEVQSPIVKITDEANGQIELEVEDGTLFKVGDAVCFDRAWAHCQAHQDRPGANKEIIVAALDGNRMILRGIAPPQRKRNRTHLSLTFPVIYGSHGQFMQVSDLTVRSRPDPKVNAGGGFSTCPVTFGNVYGVRVSRVEVDQSKADGISLQACGDMMVHDNTIRGTGQGFHPGTRTARLIFARNRSVENRLGMFYCYNNENGVYLENTFDPGISGYPGAGDVFNVMAGNIYGGDIPVEGLYGGLWFFNRCPAVRFRLPRRPKPWPYASAGRYFLFAETQTASFELAKGAKGNLVVGTMTEDGKAPLSVTAEDEANLVVAGAPSLAGKLNLPLGAGRDGLAPPPRFPNPMRFGIAAYDPASPDCGFQSALDELAGTGGTLMLPGGRYPLAAALKVPAGVTLAGGGTGTMLYAAPGYSGSLIVLDGAEKSLVRDLTVMGRCDSAVTRQAAITVRKSHGVRLEALDLRGWEGHGLSLEASGVAVRNCRFLDLSGNAILASHTGLKVETNIIRGCEAGVVATGAGEGSRIKGNVISACRGSGLQIEQARSALIYANNISFQVGAGVLLDRVETSHVLANVLRSNNRGRQDGGGLVAGRGTTGTVVAYNLVSSDDLTFCQVPGMVESRGAAKNRFLYNITCPLFAPRDGKPAEGLILQGRGSTAEHNITRTRLPSGSIAEVRALQTP